MPRRGSGVGGRGSGVGGRGSGRTRLHAVTTLETSMLVPSLGSMIIALTYIALSIVWPAVDATRQGRWLWVIAIVLLSPFAGLLWLALRVTRRRNVTA